MTVKGLGKQVYSIELRDLFALHILGGIVSDPKVKVIPETRRMICEAAYALADVALEVRDENKKESVLEP